MIHRNAPKVTFETKKEWDRTTVTQLLDGKPFSINFSYHRKDALANESIPVEFKVKPITKNEPYFDEYEEKWFGFQESFDRYAFTGLIMVSMFALLAGVSMLFQMGIRFFEQPYMVLITGEFLLMIITSLMALSFRPRTIVKRSLQFIESVKDLSK